MRHVRFRDPAGAVRQGEWTDDGIEFGGNTYEQSDVDVLPPVEPTKIVCLAGNYVEHAGGEVPDRPSLFLKAPNAVAGHGDTITLPAGKEHVDPEGEVGVVIGEQCRHVDEADAMDVVAGFTNLNDVSNRDDQEIEQNWVRGKSFDGSAPIGPAVADPEHVDDPQNPHVRLWVNGEKRQDSENDDLVFETSEVIAEVTTLLTLEPGDVVTLGTPGHPQPVEDGDTVEIEVDGVGRLRHDVRRAR
jgi:2-keto-4-pentenoate hydratase/2-oxohepta-3-ene-1,7-dioic acid hydratase in catechol pathway